MASDSSIAICNYDFRSSGTVAKSIEIATAARQAGLNIELWVVRDSGPLRARVPSSIPVFALTEGKPGCDRGSDLMRHIPALARALRTRQPATLLSGGNHFHLPLRAALGLSGRRGSIRAIARASNSAFRHTKPAWRANWDNRSKYGAYNLVVAVAHELADEITKSGIKAPVQCIANGVDLERVRELACQPSTDAFMEAPEKSGPLLVSMGRLAPQKGFDLLIDALAMLPADCPARLLVIGDGEQGYRHFLQDRACRSQVADRIDWLGYQANPFAIMARCDMFVSASRWEGASNTLLEALALGLPLVATDCPTGNREILEKGPFGTLSRSEDAGALAIAIQTEWRANRNRDGQKQGASNWAIDRCMQDWVALLSE